LLPVRPLAVEVPSCTGIQPEPEMAIEVLDSLWTRAPCLSLMKDGRTVTPPELNRRSLELDT